MIASYNKCQIMEKKIKNHVFLGSRSYDEIFPFPIALSFLLKHTTTRMSTTVATRPTTTAVAAHDMRTAASGNSQLSFDRPPWTTAKEMLHILMV